MQSLLQSICSIFHDIENYHNPLTNAHESRTGRLMSFLGSALGFDRFTCDLLNNLGSIHDIGKIAIPVTILEKRGPLTKFERQVMELHPLIGYEFIKRIEHPDIELAKMVILTHHENYDGSGYPKGLKGKEIPIEGSICSICDVYDALRETRPYRKKKTHEEVFNMMYDSSPNGLYHKFNPKLMKYFEEMSDEIQVVYNQ